MTLQRKRRNKKIFQKKDYTMYLDVVNFIYPNADLSSATCSYDRDSDLYKIALTDANIGITISKMGAKDLREIIPFTPSQTYNLGCIFKWNDNGVIRFWSGGDTFWCLIYHNLSVTKSDAKELYIGRTRNNLFVKLEFSDKEDIFWNCPK